VLSGWRFGLHPTGLQPLSASTVMSWRQSWIDSACEQLSVLFSFCWPQNWVRLVFLIFGFPDRPGFPPADSLDIHVPTPVKM
jgi:hypothetical protein